MEDLQNHKAFYSELEYIVDPIEQIRYTNIYAWTIRRSHPQESLKLASSARQIAMEFNDYSGLAYSFRNSGTASYLLSLYDEALNDLGKARDLFKGQDNLHAYATTIRTIGNVYHSIDEDEKAIDCYHEALGIVEQEGDQQGIAYNLGNIGYVRSKLGHFEEALEFMFKAIEMMEGTSDDTGMADAYGNIGLTYLKMEQLENCLQYLEKALDLSASAKHVRGLATGNQYLGQYHLHLKQPQDALDSLGASLNYARQMGEQQLVYKTLELISEAYEKLGEYQKALEALKEFEREKSQLLISMSRSTIKAMKMQNDLDKSERENEIYQLKNAELAEVNLNITDSINYALRIQNALLPSRSAWNNRLPNSFIFYRPRDIVSGDFYWMGEFGSITIYALGDCTGHGVPGAMMSMMGHNLLDQIIRDRQVTSPAQAMKMLNNKILRSLRENTEVETHDGIDIAILVINHETNVVEYVGAKIPLYIIREEVLEVVPADIFSVGEPLDPDFSYQLHTLQLDEGDQLVLTSDGFIDQFGGPLGKKFKRRRFRELIADFYRKSSAEQETFIEATFDEWRQDYEQLDDVCVIGVTL